MSLGYIWAALVIAGGVFAWKERKRVFGSKELSDAQIRQIENSGWVEKDEELDFEEIQEEEEKFWGETWDVPDEPI